MGHPLSFGFDAPSRSRPSSLTLCLEGSAETASVSSSLADDSFMRNPIRGAKAMGVFGTLLNTYFTKALNLKKQPALPLAVEASSIRQTILEHKGKNQYAI